MSERALKLWSGVGWFLRRTRERCYLDTGSAEATTFVAGMGRSGTTWVTDVINHDHSYRVLFEPLLSDELRAALGFQYIQYMDRHAHAPAAARTMELLLSGRLRIGKSDRDHRGFLFRQRIVKEIRCNLMLGWLRELRPGMPIVFVVRNPYAVAASWLRLGWAGASAPADLDIILSQRELLDAYPLVREAATRINLQDPFERIILEWCISHVVPMQQLRPDEMLVMSYDEMLTTPETAIERLATYTGCTIDRRQRENVLQKFTSTNLLGRATPSRQALLNDWREHLTASQIRRGNELLRMFDMERYCDDVASSSLH